MSENKVIYENEFFILYLTQNISTKELSNINLDSKSRDIQEKYDSENIMSTNDKLKRIDELLEYFYNFWKLVEQQNSNIIYTMYFNINLVMIQVPPAYYIKIKNILDSLKDVYKLYLLESYFKVENSLARYFLNIILNFYTPIKPIHII